MTFNHSASSSAPATALRSGCSQERSSLRSPKAVDPPPRCGGQTGPSLGVLLLKGFERKGDLGQDCGYMMLYGLFYAILLY